MAILDGFHFDLSQSQFKIDSRPNLKEQSEKTDGKLFMLPLSFILLLNADSQSKGRDCAVTLVL